MLLGQLWRWNEATTVHQKEVVYIKAAKNRSTQFSGRERFLENNHYILCWMLILDAPRGILHFFPKKKMGASTNLLDNKHHELRESHFLRLKPPFIFWCLYSLVSSFFYFFLPLFFKSISYFLFEMIWGTTNIPEDNDLNFCLALKAAASSFRHLKWVTCRKNLSNFPSGTLSSNKRYLLCQQTVLVMSLGCHNSNSTILILHMT